MNVKRKKKVLLGGALRERVVYAVLLGAALVLAAYPSWAQKGQMHRVVFELTNDSEEAGQSLLNNIENVQKAFGKENTEIEVVVHGKGLALLKNTTPLKNRVIAIARTGPKFVACENTMRRQELKKEDLLPVAGTIDSGVAEVIRKQEAGWSYIKSGS